MAQVTLHNSQELLTDVMLVDEQSTKHQSIRHAGSLLSMTIRSLRDECASGFRLGFITNLFPRSPSAGERRELCGMLMLRLEEALCHYAGVKGGSGEVDREQKTFSGTCDFHPECFALAGSG